MLTLRLGLPLLLILARTALAAPSCAPFDSAILRFAGSPVEQAACLLRGLHEQGLLDRHPISLPQALAEHVGQKVLFTKAQFRAYLAKQGIREQEIGGALDQGLSHGNSNAADAPEAGYLVIHDTSTPNLGAVPGFPAAMDSARWPFNRLASYVRSKPETAPGCVKSPDPGNQPVSHVVINRLGQSVAPVDFNTPWRATKFESQQDCRAKGLFLHVEMIQPRRDDRHFGGHNDFLAPTPGFTPAQYRRLAVVYAAASLRRGIWLVPSFHATLDEGISDGHDDPQHFVPSDWAAALTEVINAIDATPAPPTMP